MKSSGGEAGKEIPEGSKGRSSGAVPREVKVNVKEKEMHEGFEIGSDFMSDKSSYPTH
ncbi:hypothetical protein C1H46_006077 [Malus baccata]|uniref:Uncharacterized protein n=1 Tax=Malus baccata TaxID=106549 RepID=A0A540NB71_MALBA|nr:hypothetical protein C1H46_006077 [Malus baccata]